MIHTLQRHREILNVSLLNLNLTEQVSTQLDRLFNLIKMLFTAFEQGYKQEFNKIQANHTTRMEREELLRGSGISSNSGLSRRDMYLKESTHLGRYVRDAKCWKWQISTIIFVLQFTRHGERPN